MSSINNGRPPRTPGSVDTSDNSNLSKIAQKQGLFQGKAQGADEADGGGKDAKGAKGKGGSKGVHHVAAAGLGASSPSVGVSGQGTLLGTSANQPSLLPDSSEPAGATGVADGSGKGQVLVAAGTSAAPLDPEAAGQAVTQATTKLAADLKDPSVTQDTLQADMSNLAQSLNQAGITTPVSSVVLDLVDPAGAGVAPSATVSAAAQSAGIDLTTDNTDATAAQAALTKTLQTQPLSTAAVDVATAHVARTSGLAGSDAALDISGVAKSAGSSMDSGGLAALYAAAAKAGVDLTNKGDDAKSKAQNASATKKMQASDKKTYAENAGNAGGGQGRGSVNNSGATGYGTGAPGNTNTYASIPKTGPGSSAGGWDTTGNEPIAPNPSNPINFESTYGIKGGFSSVSMDDLLAQLPQLTSQYPNIKDMLTNAANSVSPALPPQLLLSTPGVETSYATNFGTNAKDGPFQFIESTFQAYGSGDRTNMQDAANACAKYYSVLLQQNGGDLYAAMRDYNGDVNQGASNSYQADQQKIFNGNANLE